MTFDPARSRGINLPSARSGDAGHREPLLCHRLLAAAHRGPCVASFRTIKTGKIDYMDAKYHDTEDPDFTKNQYSMTLRMRQVRLHKNAKYPSCWQDPQVRPQTIDFSWTVYNYCRAEDVGFVKYLSEDETYTATTTKIETNKSEDASTTPDHAR
ncbi:hypothetical protein CFC21_082790 [Triticum aestivum]|uniref:Uncharacterized protein n=3 Tax=Triticum TaxID=4564 RepID=A0A9R0XXB3_TRITD|nr:hypothetical protein CFC21_082790 [Triticum aestivum]VAI44210.1 unnamed protein product [Triticum turgidum subsp. durum]